NDRPMNEVPIISFDRIEKFRFETIVKWFGLILCSTSKNIWIKVQHEHREVDRRIRRRQATHSNRETNYIIVVAIKLINTFIGIAVANLFSNAVGNVCLTNDRLLGFHDLNDIAKKVVSLLDAINIIPLNVVLVTLVLN